MTTTSNAAEIVHVEDADARYKKYLDAFARVIERLRSYARPRSPENIRGRRKLKGGDNVSYSVARYTSAFRTFLFWLEARYPLVTEPRDVTMLMAQQYARWLATAEPPDIRGSKLWTLHPELGPLWNALVEATGAECGVEVTIVEINAHLKGSRPLDPADLEQAQLMHEQMMALLSAAGPATIRKYPTDKEKIALGIPKFHRLDPYECRYSLVPRAPMAPSSVAHQLSILSSFWKEMTKGDNTIGGEASLHYNIWATIRDQYGLEGREYTRERASNSQLTEDLVGALEEAAYARSVGCFEWYDAATGLRNMFILLALTYMGLRTEELCGALRKDLTHTADDRLILKIIGKGEKVRFVEMGGPVRDAFSRFDLELDRLRLGFLKTPEAPIWPSMGRWGRACPDKNDCKPLDPLDPYTIWSMLRKTARLALVKDLKTGEVRRLNEQELSAIHPHAFRHFFATKVRQAGLPLDMVQQLLGHKSVTTTERYLDTSRVAIIDPSTFVASARAGKTVSPDRILWEAQQQESTIEPINVTDLMMEQQVKKAEAKAKAKARKRAELRGEELEVTELTEEEPAATGKVEEPRAETGEMTAEEAGSLSEVESKPGDKRLGAAAPVWAYSEEEPTARFAPNLERESFPEATRKLLETFQRGTVSLLPYWLGTGGHWNRTEMAPVMSPTQAMPESGLQRQTMDGLRALWRKWSETEPTAASALLTWISYLLDPVAAGFEEIALSRATAWASWQEPVSGNVDAVREHLPSQIVKWFETWGSKAPRFRDQSPQLPNSKWEMPEWFMDHDPLLSLPLSERQELKQWVLKLQGQEASGRQMAVVELLVELVKNYAAALGVRGKPQDPERSSLERTDPEHNEFVLDNYPAMIAETGRKHFGITISVADILRTQVPAGDDPVRRKVLEYLKAENVGVVVEPIVKTKSKLIEGKQLTFNDEGTIRHSEAYKDSFFREHGTDSECAARRALRWLWEEKKAKGDRRRQVLLGNFDLHLVFLIPCPEAIEKVLAKRGVNPNQFDQSWKRAGLWADGVEEVARRVKLDHYLRIQTQDRIAIKAIFEEFPDQLEDTAEAMGIQVVKRHGRVAKNATQEVPDPVSLLFASHWVL